MTQPEGVSSTGRTLVLVNGVPASGKSTVVDSLRRELGEASIYDIDVIKEPFLDFFQVLTRDHHARLLEASLEVIWSLVALTGSNSVSILDCWIPEELQESVRRRLLELGIETMVEIWCHCRPEEAVARYLARIGHRHPRHLGAEFAGELEELARDELPIGIGTQFTFDSESDDSEVLASAVRAVLH